VTGDVTRFSSRKVLAEAIEAQGGKVTGSVTKKTDYLINNDVYSSSSKNGKAKELGIPIISEETFIQKFGIVPIETKE
jgi:DNA ligase (NAD+)